MNCDTACHEHFIGMEAKVAKYIYWHLLYIRFDVHCETRKSQANKTHSRFLQTEWQEKQLIREILRTFCYCSCMWRTKYIILFVQSLVTYLMVLLGVILSVMSLFSFLTAIASELPCVSSSCRLGAPPISSLEPGELWGIILWEQTADAILVNNYSVTKSLWLSWQILYDNRTLD